MSVSTVRWRTETINDAVKVKVSQSQTEAIIAGLTKRITDESTEKKKREPVVVPELSTPLAQRYARQVTAFYSLPQKRWTKRSITFSPSSAGDCSRRIFYELTNAETDPPKPPVAWQSRVSRTGDGLHHANQDDAKKMASTLADAGIQPDWRVKSLDGRPAIEAKYERTFTVNLDGETFDVSIKGRLDAVIEFLNEDGEVTDEAILDYKIKTRLAKLAPSSVRDELKKYKPQMTAYTLITDIRDVIIEMESSEKPKWSDTDDVNKDERYAHLVPTDAERYAVLQKFAVIVRCIRDGVVPAADRSYSCTFCPFQQTCDKDG